MAASKHEFRLVAADVHGVSVALLDDLDALRAALVRGLGADGDDVDWVSHRFSPHGVSLVGTACRARVALHTWPEAGVLTIDVYACGDADATLSRCTDALLGSD